MIELNTGELFGVFYNGYSIPFQGDNLKFFQIQEDMGYFFVMGKMEMVDPMGIFLNIFEAKSGGEVEIRIEGEGYIDVMKFVVTEMSVVRDSNSQTNSVAFIFASYPYEEFVTPEYSRGFGNVIGSSVVEDVVGETSYDMVDVEPSLNTRYWIQPYMNNRDFIKMIAKHSRSAFAGMNDFCYYSRRDNMFCFKSQYRLSGEASKITLANTVRSRSAVIYNMAIIVERSKVYKPLGGYGTTIYAFDETTEEFIKYEKGLDNLRIVDGARNLGYETKEEQRRTQVLDFGLKRGMLEADVRTRADFNLLKTVMHSKIIDIPVNGYHNEVHIGHTAELLFYMDQEDTDDVYTGKYLIVGNAVNVRGADVTTNFRLYRLGFNNKVGRVLG